MRGNKIKRIKSKLKMNRCSYCKSTKNLTIDHKHPKSRGGTDDIKNLMCLCRKCNGLKSSIGHTELKNLMRWFLAIQQSRVKHGYKPFFHKFINGEKEDFKFIEYYKEL